jgi:hypothetical protein
MSAGRMVPIIIHFFQPTLKEDQRSAESKKKRGRTWPVPRVLRVVLLPVHSVLIVLLVAVAPLLRVLLPFSSLLIRLLFPALRLVPSSLPFLVSEVETRASPYNVRQRRKGFVVGAAPGRMDEGRFAACAGHVDNGAGGRRRRCRESLHCCVVVGRRKRTEAEGGCWLALLDVDWT